MDDNGTFPYESRLSVLRKQRYISLLTHRLAGLRKLRYMSSWTHCLVVFCKQRDMSSLTYHMYSNPERSMEIVLVVVGGEEREGLEEPHVSALLTHVCHIIMSNFLDLVY